MRMCCALWLSCALAAVSLSGQAPTPAAPPPGETIELLWPAGAPFANGQQEHDRPSLSLYLASAERGNGTAVVVCPGGGYGTLALGHEGRDIGRHWNELGVSAFVLRYRHAPHYRHPCPMLDVKRALRMVRARALEWRVDPARLGVMGFSAGGHLAATAMTRFDAGNAAADDPIERVSCRPDFGILVYPVIAFDEPYTHQGSVRNLLGERGDDAALRAELSPERHVQATTPPCFLVHTSADTVVPAENSLAFYLALRRAKVPAELHVYEPGQHGFGLAVGHPVLGTWPGHLTAWLRGRSLLPAR